MVGNGEPAEHEPANMKPFFELFCIYKFRLRGFCLRMGTFSVRLKAGITVQGMGVVHTAHSTQYITKIHLELFILAMPDFRFPFFFFCFSVTSSG